MSRNILNDVAFLVMGAFIGSAVTWRYMKKKHEAEMNDEPFDWGEDEQNQPEDTTENTTEDSEKKEAEDIIKYNQYFQESSEKKEKESKSMNPIRVISPDEFQESEYPSLSLWHYTDGVITNDDNKIVTNATELIGSDFKNHFGEYEDDPDTVYVVNENDKVIYEIMREYGAYYGDVMDE